MAGDDPHPHPDEREIAAAERERRRLEEAQEGAHDREQLDQVRRAMRNHDERLGSPDDDE